MRNNGPDNYTYQDRVFANEINHIIQLTDKHYENMMFRDAIKTGFYDLQVHNLSSLKALVYTHLLSC